MWPCPSAAGAGWTAADQLLAPQHGPEDHGVAAGHTRGDQVSKALIGEIQRAGRESRKQARQGGVNALTVGHTAAPGSVPHHFAAAVEHHANDD